MGFRFAHLKAFSEVLKAQHQCERAPDNTLRILREPDDFEKFGLLDEPDDGGNSPPPARTKRGKPGAPPAGPKHVKPVPAAAAKAEPGPMLPPVKTKPAFPPGFSTSHSPPGFEAVIAYKAAEAGSHAGSQATRRPPPGFESLVPGDIA